MMDCLGANSEDDTENCSKRGLRCMCAEGDAYRRLQEDPETEAMEMTFYRHETDDSDCVSVIVEKNICTVDLCQLICIKAGVTATLYWSIVEYWSNKGAERVLEDHEYMLAAQYDMKRFAKKDNVRYILRQVLTKYELLDEPKKFFRTAEVNLVKDDGEIVKSCRDVFLETKVSADVCPTIYSAILIRKEGRWEKASLLLKDGVLYIAPNDRAVRMGLETLANVEMRIPLRDPTGLTEIGRATDFHIYSVKKKKNSSIISFDYNPFILRPIIPEGTTSSKQIYRFGSFSENTRLTWISAMRLAKYGKQIRENYRAFKNKQNEASSKDFGRASVPNESVRSRVAMDFTGKQGRIVEDPVEANEIALAEGYMWKRRHKMLTRRPINSKPSENHIDVGVHTMQPWFHSNLSRDQASTLVTRYGEGDGVFIVRPSRTSEGTFVLTYKCQGKLVHQQIVPMTDRERNITVFTLDNGQTKFYDILQLVEFYTMNLGPLMCRLTHYITENANIQNPNVPSPSNTPEYVNVAVNTDISIGTTENAILLDSPSGSSKTASTHSLSSRCSPN